MTNEKNSLRNKDLSDDVTEAAGVLVDAIIENLEEEYMSEIEPFEQYSKRVRLNLMKQIGEYAEKFIKGHDAIMKELSNREPE